MSLFGDQDPQQPATPGPGVPLPATKGPLDKAPAGIGLLRSRARDCASCQRRIVFVLITKRVGGAEVTRPHPMDIEPDPAGNYHLVAENGGRQIMGYRIPKRLQTGRQMLHKSHFDTCPQADQWRKGGPR